MKDLGVDGRKILGRIVKKRIEHYGLGYKAHDMGKWGDFVNTVMNHLFHKMWGFSELVEELLVSQEGLCSMFGSLLN